MGRGTMRGAGRWLGWVLVGAMAVVLGAGCTKGPDETSGEDQHRHKAAQIPLEQPVPDAFTWGEGDKTDWKWFVVPEDTLLTVNVHFVNVDAGARVQLFDTYGKLVSKHIKESGKDEHLQFSEPVRAGRFFLRISAYDEGDGSEYTVVLNVGEPNE